MTTSMCEFIQPDKVNAILADLIKRGDASLVLSNSGKGFVLQTDVVVEDVIAPTIQPDKSFVASTRSNTRVYMGDHLKV